MHEGGGRWVGSNKLVELKKKNKTVVHNVFGSRDGFRGRQFFHRLGSGQR